jgi:hypothetical protein
VASWTLARLSGPIAKSLGAANWESLGPLSAWHGLVVQPELLFKIDHFSFADCRIIETMKAKKPTLKKVQSIRCPTCGAGPGERCELSTGLPRTEPHRDRRLIAGD